MSLLCSLILIVAAGLGLSASEVPIEQTVITVANSPRHSLAGFGISASNGGNPDYRELPAASRERINRLIWQDAGTRILRLWFDLDRFNPAAGNYDLSDFRRRYIDSGLVEEALSAGCDTVLLAPTNIPPHLRSDPDAGIYDRMELADDAAATAYAAVLAEAIIMIDRDHGLLLDATGVQNEPSSRVVLTPGQFADATVALRAALDAAGSRYGSLAIIGPECASVDGTSNNYVEALRANPLAWAATDGLSAHSYNMALKEPFASQWLATSGMPYWNTEAGNTEHLSDGSFAPWGPRHGTSLVSRAINDIRHGATHWIWFLGYERATDSYGDQHRLLRFRHDGSVEELPTFHYFRALSRALPAGSTILSYSASRELGAWTYGRKPRLHALTARRPDGKLMVALANYSAEEFTAIDSNSGSFHDANAGRSAVRQAITLQLGAVATGGDPLRIERVAWNGGQTVNLSSSTGWLSTSDDTLAADASFAVTVEPMSLVTLVITKPAEQSDDTSSEVDTANDDEPTRTPDDEPTVVTTPVDEPTVDEPTVVTTPVDEPTVDDQEVAGSLQVIDLQLDLTGTVADDVTRMLVDGQEVALAAGAYDLRIAIDPGITSILVELHHEDGAVSTHRLDIGSLAGGDN